MPNPSCPMCNREPLPWDASVVEEGHQIAISGRVNCVVHPEEADYNPFSDYCTIPLYPRKGRVHYLKFKTAEEMEKLGLARNDRIEVEGCRHYIDGYPLVFAIGNVRASNLPAFGQTSVIAGLFTLRLAL